ncbi:hypothetical protein JVU11DRAFT_9498 [Chiua virens]|nr:hypothetical protein JVU11DRAFT_9498 [Chiua virens]
MYLPALPPSLGRRSLLDTPTPLDQSSFRLDTSGVSGFFGGDEAIHAMATVHIYRARRWLGWYNTPGSYQIAKRYGLVARSTLFHGLFPGVRTDPARLFELDGWQGPRFQAVNSGTLMYSTGHSASILAKECVSVEGKPIHGREGTVVGVTIVKLHKVPDKIVYPKRILAYSPFLAIIPIFSSLAACVACGVYRDWFSFSLILWGILSNGISCLVIGSGSLCFTHHIPAAGSPPGDGVLTPGKDFILLQGEEGAVNSVTLGKFSLEFPSNHYFVAQLFLIPQGSLFGQIMFIASLGVSWVYNMCLSAFDRESIQRRILLNEVLEKPLVTKYTLTTRTAAAVFALLVLSPEDPCNLLNALLPNDTKVWRKWKESILQRLLLQEELHFEEADWNLEGYSQQEKDLLRSLYGDAQAAYNGFRSVPLGPPDGSNPTLALATEPKELPKE